MLVIDQTQNNGAAEVFVGDSFRIQLSENPTTGYRWHLQSAVAPALSILEDSFEVAGSAYGSGGVRHWTFMANNPAVVALRIERRRGWQSQPVETFETTVTVRAR